MKPSAKHIALLAFIFTSPFYVYHVLSIALTGWPVPPSDDRMLALLEERRPYFDALVAKVGKKSGDVAHDHASWHLDPDWVEDVRALLRSIDAEKVYFSGRKRPITITYDGWGLSSANAWSKSFKYRHQPLQPDPSVLDLRGPDGPDLARGVLCDKNSRAASLCRSHPWVNDLDVLNRHDPGGEWRAERPVDRHWSLEFSRSR